MIRTFFGPEYVRKFCKPEKKKELICRKNIDKFITKMNHDHWSFNDSPGDTIMEKYESLFEKLNFYHKKDKLNVIISDPDSSEAMKNSQFYPFYEEIELGISKIGELIRRTIRRTRGNSFSKNKHVYFYKWKIYEDISLVKKIIFSNEDLTNGIIINTDIECVKKHR